MRKQRQNQLQMIVGDEKGAGVADAHLLEAPEISRSIFLAAFEPELVLCRSKCLDKFNERFFDIGLSASQVNPLRQPSLHLFDIQKLLVIKLLLLGEGLVLAVSRKGLRPILLGMSLLFVVVISPLFLSFFIQFFIRV